MKIKNIVTVLLVAFILASCAPAAKVVPTETAILTLTFTPVPPTPTITPTPIPTIYIEGQNIPDPRFSNPELFNLEKPSAPIPQFVHALSSAGIEVNAQAVNDSVVYKTVKAKNSDIAILLMTTDFPETSYDEGNTPLLVYMKDPKAGEYAWSATYLKDVASLHNILIGAVYGMSEEIELNKKNKFFTNNFNMATIAWSSVDVPISLMDQNTRYRLRELENENVKEIMWFHLGDEPLDNMTFASKDEAVSYVNSEVDKIVQKYGDKITIANILNEVNPFTKNGWHLWKKFGDDFFVEVYQHVRESLPHTKIIYNESYNYTKSHEGTLYPYSVEVVNALKGHIDAVGMEMHMAQSQWGADTPTSVDEMADIMRSFGIPIYVTELDVNQTYLSGSDQEKNIKQAEIYEMVVRSCVRSEVCEIINFWGQADPYSWYVFAINEPNSKACLFDENGNPKLGYYGVLRGLTEGFVPPAP